MISEQDKKAILNGVLARTNNNKKAKFILKSEHEANFNYPYLFLISDKDKCYTDWYNEHLNSKQDKFNSSIVELWQDEPEPFYLNRALAGEPICYGNDSRKYWVIGRTRENQYIENNVYVLQRDVTNTAQRLIYLFDLDDLTKNSVMWKEPQHKPQTVTLTLPCPLKEPKDEMWFITIDNEVSKSNYKNNSISKETFERRIYFGSEQDAKAWLDAMRNNRR